jgi:HK97 family phage major capsid protein
MLQSTNISGTGTFPQPLYLQGLNGLAGRKLVFAATANRNMTSSPYIIYVEKQNRDGSAGMTAEGSDKTQADFDIVASTETVKKITTWIKVSEEMLSDIPYMASEINNELSYQIGLLEDTQLYSGDGNGNNLKGLIKTGYAQPLDNATLEDTVAKNMATYWDCLSAAISQIEINMQNKAEANAIFLHPADVFALYSAQRNVSGDYLVPAFVSPTMLAVRGVPIFSSTAVTAGNFLVADMRLFNVYEREGLTYRIGYEGDDLIKNLVTIVAEKRLASFIKANDVEAFVYESFADAILFIEKP